MAFVFFYIAMLFPFIRKILKIYYLNKIIIPDFIVTYLEDKNWLRRAVDHSIRLDLSLHFCSLHVCPS